MRRSRLFLAILAIAGVAGSSAFAVISAEAHRASTQSTQRSSETVTAEQQNALLSGGGLHAAAKVTGSFIGKTGYSNVGAPASLGELAGLSQAIVVGSTLGNVSRPTADGRSIITIYNVAIQQVLKGAVSSSSTISVVIRGGHVAFPDGSWAELRTSNMERPADTGATWAWFLRAAPSALIQGNETFLADGGAFVPTFGPLSYFDLTLRREATVRPAGFRNSALGMQVYHDHLNRDDFIREIQKAIKAN